MQLFLSIVSDEFRSQRDLLRHPRCPRGRDGKYVRDPAQIQAQQDHLACLLAMEHYPGVALFAALASEHAPRTLLRQNI